MAKWCIMLILALAVSVYAVVTARDVPKENKNNIGLTDQKNVYTYGGTGGYNGLGNNGLPMGGMGTGVGVGGDIGGVSGNGGIGMGYQYGGPGGAGGVGNVGGLGNGFGGLPTLGGGVFPIGGGVFPIGGGVLPHP